MDGNRTVAVVVVLPSGFLLFSIMRLCWPDIQCGKDPSMCQYLNLDYVISSVRLSLC